MWLPGAWVTCEHRFSREESRTRRACMCCREQRVFMTSLMRNHQCVLLGSHMSVADVCLNSGPYPDLSDYPFLMQIQTLTLKHIMKTNQTSDKNQLWTHYQHPQITLVIFFNWNTSLPSWMRKDSFSCSGMLVVCDSHHGSQHPRPLWWILSRLAEASSNRRLLKEKRRTAWNFTHIPSHMWGLADTQK